MKKIYIVLTYTGTILSKLVKAYTKKEFSHVSISLDEGLKEMYSFGRLNPYLIVPAGFVNEHVDSGTFKRFDPIKTKIYSLDVSDEQYDRLKTLIEEFKDKQLKFDFNIIGLFTAAFRVKLPRRRHLYCAEFVKYLLDHSNIDTNLPVCVRPDDFQHLENTSPVYYGILKDYSNS